MEQFKKEMAEAFKKGRTPKQDAGPLLLFLEEDNHTVKIMGTGDVLHIDRFSGSEIRSKLEDGKMVSVKIVAI